MLVRYRTSFPLHTPADSPMCSARANVYVIDDDDHRRHSSPRRYFILRFIYIYIPGGAGTRPRAVTRERLESLL